MATITWTDKTDATVSGLAESQKWTAASAAEVKSVVNTNAGLVTTNTVNLQALGLRSGSVAFTYTYSVSTAASDPGAGFFRLDNANPSLATHIYINVSEKNLDISSVFEVLNADSVIFIQDRGDNQKSGVFKYVSAVDNTTWYDITVTAEDASTTFPAGSFSALSFLTKPATGAGTGTVTSVTAGTGLSQTGTATINPTLLIDYLGTDNFIDSATNLEGTDIATGDTIAYHDASDSNVKKGFVSDLPFASKTASESFIVALSDETTDLTTGTAKASIRMPYAFTLTDVRASVNTAPTGSVLTVDINESVSSILSTKLTIDATEVSSETAATPAVISDSSLADDGDISFDIDTVGSTISGAGLKVTLIGYKT